MIPCINAPIRMSDAKLSESHLAKTAEGKDEMRVRARLSINMPIPEDEVSGLPEDLQDLVRAQIRSTSLVKEGKGTDNTSRKREFPIARHQFTLAPGTKSVQMVEVTGTTVLGLRVKTVNGVTELSWKVEANIPLECLPTLASMLGDDVGLSLSIVPLQSGITFVDPEDDAEPVKPKTKKASTPKTKGKSAKKAAKQPQPQPLEA